jgi:hypothetical protein
MALSVRIHWQKLADKVAPCSRADDQLPMHSCALRDNTCSMNLTCGFRYQTFERTFKSLVILLEKKDMD